ncbi:MarR family winged helix-turn-helix transcriptional regulator [Psychromonas sp. PT13]|uniref:MarR family winged helix-turn-helix transcriptional regulator n=1 Tax=Psychromonas sp. PT13 TaxID=3439547 RepID=UPI003EB6A9DB
MNTKPIAEIIFDLVLEYKFSIRSCLKANELGINGMHVKCLSFLRENDVCTPNDIAVYFSRDKAQVARLIKEMIDHKWVVKTPNPNDKRSNFLSLTNNGIELANVVDQAQSELRIKMEGNLTEQELEEFKRIAIILQDNLKQ